jgi:hypothetical protein
MSELPEHVARNRARRRIRPEGSLRLVGSMVGTSFGLLASASPIAQYGIDAENN